MKNNDPEIDIAVAKAIGLESAVLYGGKVLVTPREWDEIRGIPRLTCEGDLVCGLFQPSEDLNTAFAAAEVVELFSQYAYCRASGQHVISKTVPVASWGDTLSNQPTPALAICAAILKLKES